MNTLKNFWNDETGLELSEYAVGAGLIVLGVGLAFTQLGSVITTKIGNLASSVSS